MKKTIVERINEVRNLYLQLDGLGLHAHIDEVAEFRQIANEFVRNGTSASGSIPIPSAKRWLVYTFSNQKSVASNVVLTKMK